MKTKIARATYVRINIREREKKTNTPTQDGSGANASAEGRHFLAEVVICLRIARCASLVLLVSVAREFCFKEHKSAPDVARYELRFILDFLRSSWRKNASLMSNREHPRVPEHWNPAGKVLVFFSESEEWCA